MIFARPTFRDAESLSAIIGFDSRHGDRNPGRKSAETDVQYISSTFIVDDRDSVCQPRVGIVVVDYTG
jgi:hypothetical protein